MGNADLPPVHVLQEPLEIPTAHILDSISDHVKQGAKLYEILSHINYLHYCYWDSIDIFLLGNHIHRKASLNLAILEGGSLHKYLEEDDRRR